MSKFLEPGCHPDVSHQDYIDDPVDGGSLNSSSIIPLVLDCPKRYWINSPLNPDRDPQEHKKHFTMGSLIHDILLLGSKNIHQRYHLLSPEFKDLRSKAAREERDEAIERGLMVIKQDDLDKGNKVAEYARRNPRIGEVFDKGENEQTLIWQCKETGVMCRVRFDKFNHEHLFGVDYKTAKNANPREFQRSISDYGYYVQAAMYMDGYYNVFGKRLKKFWFVAQEIEQPEMISAIELDAVALDWGRVLFNAAKRKYAECKKNDYWPGYDEVTHKVGLTGWTEAKLETIKDETGNFGDNDE